MGKRGPLPANHLEPKPEVINDRTAPETLDDRATEEWDRIVNELADLGRICNLDRSMLMVHCQAVADYERYGEALEQHGDTYTTLSGQIKFRPEVQGRKSASETIIKTAQELGFTPNSRSRMNVPTKTPSKEPTQELYEILDGSK